MKRFVLIFVVILFAWGVQANAAKFYEQATALNRMTWKLDSLLTATLPLDAVLDSIATLLSAPTPVAVSWSTLASGITLRDSTGLWWTGTRTFPLTAGPNIDGARAVLLELTWEFWKDGGTNAFTLWNVFSPSATDTTCVTAIQSTCTPDSIDCGDSTGVFAGQDIVNVHGSATILVPIPAGAGHHFVRMKPHHTCMYIYKLNIRARYVW